LENPTFTTVQVRYCLAYIGICYLQIFKEVGFPLPNKGKTILLHILGLVAGCVNKNQRGLVKIIDFSMEL